MEKTKKPAIRFEGFTEDWEKKPLSAFSNKVSEKNTNNQYAETFTNSAEFGVISQRDFFDHDISNAENINGYYIVKSDDFVYNPRISVTAPCGPINRNKLGRSGVMSPLYTVFRTNDVNKLFLEWYFKSDYWHSYMYFNGDSGARSDRFSIKNDLFFQMPIPVPSTEEQQQIGFALDEINDTITLHQQKYDKLLTFKKSMLEKLFPQNGAKVPEVRFAGFAGEWESHPLNEIADRIVEKNIGCSITETFTNSAEYGVISQRDFFDHDISNKANLGNYYIIKDNDFVYNPRISVTAPCGPINRNKLGRTGVTSPLYTVFRTHDIDNEYLEWYFKSHYWFSFMRYNGDSGARSDRFSIKNDLFFQMPIPVPKIEEQIKIGAFLKSLDKLVSLYSAELEKLKNIKTALLEKMFV